ncbi:FG-GAP-like repeat-containing protein [Tundrisphaera sp. TA3]|uniref:FG-GAP-like repeat-containing protein n=1 Tax=Tundrisphaera sp. TA3 TaxID=3435775 RepID=UPI003EBE5EEB
MPDPSPKLNNSRRRLGIGSGAVAAIILFLGWRCSAGRVEWPAIQAAIDARDWAGAESLLSRRVEQEPADSRAWLALGSVLATLGREPESISAYGRVSPRDPTWSQARLSLGDVLWKQADAKGAEDAYRRAVDSDANGVQPRARLLRLLIVERRIEEARGILRELLRLTGDARHLITLTGMALEAGSDQFRDLNGENERLTRELVPLLARSPDDPWLRRARGLLRFDLGHPAEARADLEFAADRFDHDPAVRLALVGCLLSLGDLSGVEDRFGTPPENPVDRGRWWFLRGRVEQARGRDAEAIAAWREAASADPQHRAASYQLGQALLRLGRPDEAGPFLARAETIRVRWEAIKAALNAQLKGTKDAGACESLGRLCLDAGLRVEGRGWLRRAIQFDPSLVTAQATLATLGDEPDRAGPFPRLMADRPGKAGTPAVPGPRSPARSGPRFEEVAEARGLRFRHDSGARGDLFIGDTMGGGVGLIDYDGDGWLDVYFVNGCRRPVDRAAPPAPNRLFRNIGQGRFEDVTERAGVGGKGDGTGCTVGDYDNDGHDDLFVTGLGSTVLYRNRGDGTFADVTEAASVGSSRWCTAAGFGDLDGDGDLDLVVVTYVDADPAKSPPCHDALGKPIHCPPGKFPAQFDHLFRNNGDGTFADASREAGLEVPDGRGLGLAIADLDDDGRLDLFVANDAVPDFLFLNRGGLRFEEVGASAGAAFDGNGNATASMGVVADDLDGDGRIDLFHTNFRNEGNTLLRNLGGGQFADISAGSGLDGPSRPVTGFGTVAIDGDNDGRLDLFVANGHVDDQPWLDQPMAQRPSWYSGRPSGRFAPAGDEVSPYLGRPVVGRGVASGDLDNDGRVDLVVVHRDGTAALLRNVGEGGHWLGVRLVGSKSGRTPIGARVVCRAGGSTSTRWLSSGTSYLSSSDQRLWFGLGTAATIDELEIRWPSGAISRRSNFPADRIIELVEPGPG